MTPVPALTPLPLADESVVLCVRADPEPHDIRFVLQGECPVVQANPDGPEATNPLQVQGGMPRVFRPPVAGRPPEAGDSSARTLGWHGVSPIRAAALA